MTRKFPELPDHDLWAEVVKGIKPLNRHPLKKRNGVHHAQNLAAPLPKPAGLIHAPPPAPKPATRSGPPPLSAFDRRTEQRLQRGQAEIDARIDLHGSGLEVARVRLHDFITHARASGARLVLVITGKGASPFSSHTLHGRDHYHAPEREGKLRRHVPGWLAEPEFRHHVVGYQPAHPRHGGGGALYVRLRRNRALET
jgi:DNA-nicking Smr family endonuclease